MNTRVLHPVCLSLLFFAQFSPARFNPAQLNPALFNPWPNRATAQSNETRDSRAVQIAMKNVTYHFTGPIAVHIVELDGHLIPATPGAIVFFDDKNSFSLAISSAQITMGC